MTTGREITTYDEAYAKAAAEYAQQDRSSSATFLSTRAGVLRFGDEELPGNQVAAVIIDSVLENAYYEGKYEPDAPMPPKCYAFTRGNPDEMQPHLESMSRAQDFFMPQHFEGGEIKGCAGCPKNVFGSSDTGRGKACKNQYRLALLPAGLYQSSPHSRDLQLGLFDDPAHFDTADIVFLKLPVTSGKAFEDYRKTLRLQHGRPPFGAVTRIFLTPDSRSQFKVNFQLVQLLEDRYAPGVIARVNMQTAEPFQGYEKPEERPQQSGGFGGFNRR